jgi:serine/threonine protein kinase
VMQEVLLLRRLKHINIVRLFEYFETDKYLLFVIELCQGGDLLNYVRRRRRLKEDVAKCLFKQLIESLAYCHSKNILHRDIKLDNILLDANGQVKICDFGVGKIVRKGERMTE